MKMLLKKYTIFIIGEAKFLRALIYFHLTRLFGDVPLTLNETLSLEDLKLSRASSEDVYNQIINDLEEARLNLPVVAEVAGRASASAASALLAKVYLTVQDFTQAKEKALEVINTGQYSLWENYAEIFMQDNENGKESIFDVQFEPNIDANSLNIYALPRELNDYISGSPVYALYEVSEELSNSYETDDLWAEINVVDSFKVSDSVIINFNPLIFKYSNGVFTTKGQVFNQAGNSGINFPILHYAEVLLILEEAENELSGPYAEVYEALNQIRRRAYGQNLMEESSVDLTTGMSKEAFREAIWMERFREFPLEAKHWFDLLRTDRAEEVLDIDATRTLYPIPQRELDVNSMLTQNDGY